MKREYKYVLPPIVIIALIFTFTPDYCPQESFNGSSTSHLQNKSKFNPFCYIAGFNPEAPEIQVNNIVNLDNSIFSVTASGTSMSTISPSPSFAAPEENNY